MKATNILLVLASVFLFCGCSKETPLVEENTNLPATRVTGNERVLSLSGMTRLGTTFHGVFINSSAILPANITVRFEVRPKAPATSIPMVYNEVFSLPATIPAGQHYVELEDLPYWSTAITGGTTKKYSIKIKQVEYNGDTDPLYVDTSQWTFEADELYDEYGFTVNKIYSSYEGKRNIRYPYDVIDPPLSPIDPPTPVPVHFPPGLPTE
jgi:hypothetical protein